MRGIVLIALVALTLGGCYSSRATSISTSTAESVLKQDGFSTQKVDGGIQSSYEWQKPNNAPSALCFGLIWTRHRVVNGTVTSETYGWSLIPGLFGILPGFLVNLPLPLEDDTNRALTSPSK